jgi:hypothetical protein
MLPRLQLFEIEDQRWCPRWLRDALTGYLQTMIARTRPYAPAVPALAALLRETATHDVVDLCSGAGGPWPALRDDLAAAGATAQVTCTDLAPNADAAARLGETAGMRYLEESVSALAVPPDLRGARTMFTALHHFTPDQVRAILADAQAARAPFAAFEATSRSVAGLLVTLFIPLAVLFVMPLVKPRRPLALVLTYLPPLVPLAVWWDGVVSTLRTYRVDELRAIVASLPPAPYEWTVAELPSRGLPLLALTGRPH